MTQHLGMPIPSPALMEKIGTKFRRAVDSFASANGIPWVKFGKDDRKIDVMTPYLDRQAARAGQGWPRSGWRRNSSGSGPPTSAIPGPRRRSTPSPRLTGG